MHKKVISFFTFISTCNCTYPVKDLLMDKHLFLKSKCLLVNKNQMSVKIHLNICPPPSRPKCLSKFNCISVPPQCSNVRQNSIGYLSHPHSGPLSGERQYFAIPILLETISHFIGIMFYLYASINSLFIFQCFWS